jgi:uncharacterized protein with von Willebrand factor type A (vWA) domain
MLGERVYGTNMQHAFLLEDAPGLVAFAERLAKLTGGQVFGLASADLGERILRDYLSG